MKLIAIYISLFTIALAITIIFVFPKWIVDDAFISFRYASNLVNHSSLTWNVGEAPVEGYTGLVLPVFSALVILFNLSPVNATHILGILSFLFGIIILFKLLSKLNFTPICTTLVMIFYCTMPALYTHCWSGLETLLFSSSCLACIYFSIVLLQSKKRQIKYNTILLMFFLFVSLIRPEGVVLSVLLSAVLFFLMFRENRRDGSIFFRSWIFVYLIPGLIYFIWRWSYYGDILPNTFYAKQYDGLFSSESFNFMLDFLIKFIAFPCALAVMLFAITRSSGIKLRELFKSDSIFFWIYWASLIFLLIVTAQYLHSNLLMNYSFRFFIPYFPLLLIGLFYLIDRYFNIIFGLRKQQPAIFWIGVIVILAATCSQLWINYRGMATEIRYANRYKNLLESEHIPIGKMLNKIIPANEWLIVDADAGAIPYYSQLKTIDCFKLNDRYLAREMPTDKKLVDYYYSFNPGVIVITSFDWDTVKHYTDAKLITGDPRFRNYSLYSKFRGSYWKYYEFVYLRNDLL